MKAKKSKLKDGEFKYGDVEMTDEEYQEAQNPKVRTTIFLDEDLIRTYKGEATKRGIKYQQLIRQKLRDALDHPDPIEERLHRLEQKVFKGKHHGH